MLYVLFLQVLSDANQIHANMVERAQRVVQATTALALMDMKGTIVAVGIVHLMLVHCIYSAIL